MNSSDTHMAAKYGAPINYFSKVTQKYYSFEFLYVHVFVSVNLLQGGEDS